MKLSEGLLTGYMQFIPNWVFYASIPIIQGSCDLKYSEKTKGVTLLYFQQLTYQICYYVFLHALFICLITYTGRT